MNSGRVESKEGTIRRLAIASIVTIWLLILPGRASTQPPPVVCSSCWSCCFLDPMGCHAVDLDDGGPWCSTCTHECLYIPCGIHMQCENDSIPDADGDLQALDSVVLLALLQGDVATLERLLQQKPGALRLNLERGSVQLYQCGALFANFPVQAPLLYLLAQRARPESGNRLGVPGRGEVRVSRLRR